MRKVPVLLGLAAVLAAGIALFFFLDRSGGGNGRAVDRTASALRPGDALAKSPDAALSADEPLPDEEAPSRDREAAKVASKVTPGAERVIPASSEVDGDELYGIVLGIYGVPVAGAEVEVKSIGDTADGLLQVLGGSTDKKAVTKKDGTFRVPRPDRWEEVRVTITARGFLDFSRSQDLIDRDGDQDLGVFELEAGVVLGGKVLDADGEPVAGASVRRVDSEDESFQFRGRFGGDDGSVETGADGRFELPHQETGDYVLVVDHDDHPTGRFPGVTPQAGGENTSLVLRLPRGASLAGVIQEFPTGRDHVRVSAQLIDPMADADSGFSAMLAESGFSADGLEADAEADGSFLIKGVEAGKSYKVRAFTRSGFLGRTPVSEEQTAKAGEKGIELLWKPGGSVTARVVDEATSAEIDEVEVRFRWDADDDDFDFSNQTKQRRFRSGKVEIDELRPSAGQETLSLLFSAPGYLDTRHENVAVTEEDDVDIGTIRMRRAPTLRIHVVDAEGKSVKRARVRLEPEEPDDDEGGVNGPAGWFSLDKRATTGKTDSDGVVELAAPATPTARLEISHPSFAGYQRRGVPMPAAGTQEEEIRLAEGGTIEVLVVDANGTPVPDIRVRHRYPEEALEDRTASHETNRRGQVRLRNQLAGMHGFRTSEDRASSDDEPEWQEFAVSDGRKTEVVLEVAARATLEGKITESGSALDRANVALVQVEESPMDDISINISIGPGRRTVNGRTQGSDRTDRLGRYSLEDVPAGEYRLKVTHDDRAAPHYVPVTVHGGSNRLDADLPVNAVEGRIVSAGGTPIEGAALKLVPTRPEGGEGADLERQALEDLFGSGRSEVKTAADGSYRLRGVPTDKPFRVEASRTGYISARSEEVTVSLGQTRRGVDVELRTGGTLRVRVVGETGPFTFLQARWDGDGDIGSRTQVSMVRRGEVVFRGLEPGPWIVERARSDEDGNEQRIVVQEVGETVMDFTP